MVEETMILEPWEWERGARECIMAIKESVRKKGFDLVEVWADTLPGVVRVHYCSPPKNIPYAVYRGRT